MNSRHKKTLAVILSKPIPLGVHWLDVESMLLAMSAKLTEGSGSRVRFDLNGITLTAHRPHPLRRLSDIRLKMF